MKKHILNTFFFATLLLCVNFVTAQTTHYTWGDKSYNTLERLEIKVRTDLRLNTNFVRQWERKKNTEVADSVWLLDQQAQLDFNLTAVDKHLLNRLIANSSEYSALDQGPAGWESERRFLQHFWPTPANFIEVNTPDFYLSVNPALSQQQSFERGYDQRVYVNSKGMNARGLIANKIGFKMYVTDNQEMGPVQFREFLQQNRAVPGAGFWKNFKNNKGVDYIDARGSVDFNITPYVQTSFGYDQHFMGDGYRSIFRSNFSAPALYLSLHTRVGKFDYYNLFNEIISFPVSRGDVLFNKKYMATHHLSYMVTPWLRLGLFESMVFARTNKFDISYLNPIILTNTALRRKNGENNANLGFDFKANLPYNMQLYGQYLIDNLDGGNENSDKTNGWQIGGKALDVFNIPNLDVQAEINQVRPFTYSRGDSVTQYTNYLQPLAHPLGANFREYIGIVRYQPFPRWMAEAKLIYWNQGVNTQINWGSNPNILSDSRTDVGGNLFLKGEPLKVLNASGLLAFEVRENLFIEAMALVRMQRKGDPEVERNTVMGTLGIRWNMFRRMYDY